jgi:hypothetical protein
MINFTPRSANAPPVCLGGELTPGRKTADAGPTLQFLAVITLLVLRYEDGDQLVAALADLTSRLFEADVVTELRERFVLGERVQIDGVQERPGEVEDGGFGHFTFLREGSATAPPTLLRSASIRSTTFSPRGRSFGVIGVLARFLLMRSTSAVS